MEHDSLGTSLALGLPAALGAMRRPRALWTGNSRVPIPPPLKSTRGQPRPSHSGSGEWGPSQPERRPSQVNLCPVSPLQGQEVFISSATPQPSPAAAPRGRGAPHSHPRCPCPWGIPSCSPPASPAPPMRPRSPRRGRIPLPTGNAGGPGGSPKALSRSSRASGCAPGRRCHGGAEGAAPTACCKKPLGAIGGVGGGVRVCAQDSRVLGFTK